MKKVIVTWASDWLGLALAKLLVADGVEVVNVSRRKPPIDIHNIQAEFSNSADIKNAILEIEKKHPEFDALVNCVWMVNFHTLDGINFDEITQALQVNVSATAALTSGLIPLIKKNNADIMIVSSTLGFKSYPDQAAYTAWTRAKRGLSHYFRSELKDNASRVISFCPWGMQTRFHEKVTWKKIDNSQYMPVEWVALCMKQLLELPKYMEVSEIVINRKPL